MIKKTFKQLQELDLIVGNMYRKDPILSTTKFGYAYKKFYKNNFQPTLDIMKDKLLDARMDNALENKDTGEIIFDQQSPRGFKYSKEGLKKLIPIERKIEEEFDLKEVEIEPYESAFIPKDLKEEEQEALEEYGFISLKKETESKS